MRPKIGDILYLEVRVVQGGEGTERSDGNVICHPTKGPLPLLGHVSMPYIVQESVLMRREDIPRITRVRM